MADIDDVDLVRDLGMPNGFTPYTIFLTVYLALTWALAAIPAMIPAFVAPTGSSGSIANGTGPIVNFRTVIEEFGLDERAAEWTQQAYFLGSLTLGQIPCAYSDIYGRRMIVFYSALGTGLAGLLCCWAPTYWVFLAGRFLQGAFFTATTNVNWVMVCESVPLSRHGRASMIFGVMWVIGYVSIAPLAMLFPTWRQLFFITSLPTVFYAFVALATIRESLAFLFTKKRMREVAEWIKHMEKFGGVKFEGGVHDSLLAYEEQDSDRSGGSSPIQRVRPVSYATPSPPPRQSMYSVVREALSNRTLVFYLMISNYMWITDFLVYNGLSLTSTGIKVGDARWNYVMSGLVELPATFALPFLMDTIGRRYTVIISHSETALTMGLMVFIALDNHWLYMGVWLLAKFGTASSFIALYIYGSEIFPVKYRNICLGICCTLGNLGAMIAPFTARWGVSAPAVIFGVYAGVSLLSAFLCIRLPETSARHAAAAVSRMDADPDDDAERGGSGAFVRVVD